MSVELAMGVAAPFHILYVEDAPDEYADARPMLVRGSARRYKFTQVNTAADALRALREMATPPDCILLDFSLPDMDALQLLAELRAGKLLPVAPVVVLTVVADSGAKVLFAGAQEFVGKSWTSPESLTRAVDSAVDRYALTRERLRVTDALRASDEVLRLFVRNAPAAVAQFDQEMRYVCASGRWLRDYGLTGDVTGRSHGELVPELRDEWTQIHERVLAGETLYSKGDRSEQADGRVRWRQWEALPWRDATGGIGGVLMAAEDITDRVQAEEELLRLANEVAEAGRRKDEFLATLAHELRNPLAPIRNGLRLLKLANGGAVATEAVRSMIERQTEQLVHLVDDLLDVSRIGSGKLRLRTERIDLAVVLHSAMDTSRPLMEAAGHVLTVDLPTAPMFVDADVTRLAQVFANLLNNAAKFTDHGGRIRLAVACEGGDVLVSVTDTGIGIPSAMLLNVFQMFSQLDQSLEKTQGGLGIGLCLVKQLVELHGGLVEARSAGLGRGSEFVVRLPLAQSAARELLPPPVEAPPSAPSRRCRVVVADDNVDAAESLSALLAIVGHEVRTVGDGEMAVALAESFRPDVMLLDIGMPTLNGHDAARRIRQQPWGGQVMLIALTGWGQEEVRLRSLEAGFDRHLVKPVNFADLTRLLSSLPTPGA
jgi:PAS domain S-box-containing protein